MFRKEITNADLLLTYKPWYSFGQYTPYRNLSEEVRKLDKLREKAKTKYLELERLHVVASTNVAEELESLQYLLLDNSKAYYEVEVESSILEEREGTRYRFNRGNNNKQGQASSNKDKQQQNQKQQQNTSRKGGNVVSVAQLMGAKLILH